MADPSQVNLERAAEMLKEQRKQGYLFLAKVSDFLMDIASEEDVRLEPNKYSIDDLCSAILAQFPGVSNVVDQIAEHL
jgi:tRNA G26 N,N-dimethylase Trm1